jgi:hypothetical protein
VEKGSYEENMLNEEENKEILGLSLDILVYEKSALLHCYAALSGNFLPMFRENLTVPSSKSQEIQILVLFQKRINPQKIMYLNILYFF